MIGLRFDGHSTVFRRPVAVESQTNGVKSKSNCSSNQPIIGGWCLDCARQSLTEFDWKRNKLPLPEVQTRYFRILYITGSTPGPPKHCRNGPGRSRQTWLRTAENDLTRIYQHGGLSWKPRPGWSMKVLWTLLILAWFLRPADVKCECERKCKFIRIIVHNALDALVISKQLRLQFRLKNWKSGKVFLKSSSNEMAKCSR